MFTNGCDRVFHAKFVCQTCGSYDGAYAFPYDPNDHPEASIAGCFWFFFLHNEAYDILWDLKHRIAYRARFDLFCAIGSDDDPGMPFGHYQLCLQSAG